jgi:hypothetical protein
VSRGGSQDATTLTQSVSTISTESGIKAFFPTAPWGPVDNGRESPLGVPAVVTLTTKRIEPL